MDGPHDTGADPLLGFQSSLSPAQIYHDGIKAFDDWCRETKGAAFTEPDLVAQDAALTALDAGAVNLPDALRDFFDLLLQNTKEGFFSGPRYGGNHGMAG